MSVKAMTWVWDHSPYKLGSRLVHLALADVANDMHDNELWMQQSSIADKAQLSVVQVQRILKTMVADGYLDLLEQGGGRGRVSRYRMIMETPQNDGVLDIKPIILEGENLSSDEASPITNSREPKPSENADDPLRGFDIFWTAYPKRNGRRIGKAQVLRRWAKMPLDAKRAAYRGAVNYATAVDSGQTLAKDPDRWLRDHCWDDWLTEEVTYERKEWEA